MNNLQIFSADIIPVYTTDTGERVVIGRELHEKLGIGRDYSNWFKAMCDYGFYEGKDYSPILADRSDGKAGKPRTEHLLRLDMAKHIAMIQRTPQGKAIRDKLIALETHVAELSPQLQLLINLEMRQKRQQKAIEDVNQRVDDIRDVVALSPNSWRTDARNLITGIAYAMGGTEYIRDVNAEIYRLVDERAAVSLATRLTNKRRRMADEGVCKSKRDKLNKVDVIADDKKLIEIYIAVVKEMAVKYGVKLQSSPLGA